MTNYYDDPIDVAEHPPQWSSDIWGEANVNVWFCTLQKGIGRVPYNLNKDPIEQRRTAIDLTIIPLSETGAQYNIERSLIAESREWAGLVLPSLKDVGISLRELNGKFVRVHLEPTGQTYVNQAGETKERTMPKFLAVWDKREDCLEDWKANSNNTPQTAVETATATTTESQDNGNSNNKERETALKFARVIVQNAARGQSDVAVIQQTVAVNLPRYPLVNKYFTAESPEILELIAEELGK